MSTKPGTFSGFRGCQGTRDRNRLIGYVRRFLGVDTVLLIAEWECTFNHIAKYEGEVQAVRKCKGLYDYALRYSAGIKADPLPFTRSDRSGFPRLLARFRPYLDGSSDSRRAALTVLQCFKLHPVNPPYTLASITDPYAGEERPEWVQAFIQVVEREFPLDQQSERVRGLKTGFHISGRNGPNGPCVGTAYVDREAIRNTNIETSVKALARLTGFNYLCGLLDSTQEPCDVHHKSGRVKAHSRIRIKYEPGGKARPFAICDFFSQSSLKSIHSYTMDWLKRRRTDGTAEHSRAAQTVRKWTANPKVPLWSFDLTSATDRFPVFLQEIVLKQMFGQEIADLWKDIVCNRTFIGPEGEEVRFAVGQPLGALSSWSVFAVTHHLLVQTAAFESFGPKSKWFQMYRMIGDDICIARSRKVAERYKHYLDTLDVKISLTKSVTPDQLTRGNSGEIAKRLFHQGIEVTPVPPAAVLESSRSLIGFKNLIEQSWDRGYISAGSPYPVQSTLSKKIEYAALTFPLRNRCPQLNGVTSLFQRWEASNNDAPAGLAPGWFIWADCPNEVIIKATRKFLFEKVDAAVQKSLLLCQRIQLARYMKSEREELPHQGGDWKPSPLDCHADVLTEVFSELNEVLMQNQQRLWSENILIGDVVDLYSFIGQLHKYLEPEILLTGRDFQDEKQKTSVFVSSLVKYVSKIHVSGDYSILDQEPEVEQMPLLDDLDFLPSDFLFE